MTLASSATAEPRKPTHVACVGDSITAGNGATSTAKNYPSQLQMLLGSSVQVKNFGNSGSTMLSDGFGDKPYIKQAEYTNATSFVSNAGAGAVVSVVIILGANDSKPYNWDPAAGKNDQQYLKDYRAMVEHFAGLSTKPTIYLGYPLATGSNPCCDIRGNVMHDEQIPLIAQLAMEKHLPVIDLNTPTTNHPEYFGDGVHPNDAGYLVMANLVKKGLEREPTVNITAPAMGATLGAGMLPLTADASGGTVDISSVEFFEGVTSLGKATAKPFSVIWLAASGTHQITAKATDTTLANATSAAVSFTAVEGGGGGAAGGAAGGGAGGGGVAGSGGGLANAGGGGLPSAGSGGGLASAGSGASGAAAVTAGAAGVSALGGSGVGGMGPGTSTPSTPTTDSGCGCAVPGSPPRGGGVLLLASLLALAGLRRRAA
ncbi:MAG: GDSL-type esterase/lipase family protein [Myxococcales bacterium]